MKQKTKFVLLLAILVILPICALGIISLHTLKTDLNSYELKVDNFAHQQLVQVSNDITSLMQKLTETLHQDVTGFEKRGKMFMRCSTQIYCSDVRKQGVDQIIIFNADGEQIFPPVQRSSQHYLESIALKKLSSSLNTAITRLMPLPVDEKKQGVWTNFSSPEEQKLLHCWLNDQNTIHCTVINWPWLSKNLIEQIKTSLGAQKNFQLRFLGSNRTPIWQSENFQKTKLIGVRPLNPPLHFWRLEIWQSVVPTNYNYPLTLIALIVPLTALIAAIAFTLFREQKHALSEAENRANFAASVSHELRTPLTNLQLYADLINEKSNSSAPDKTETITKYSQIISSETTRLSELVDNALTIAKGHSSANGCLTQAIPDDIIRETVSRLKPLLKNELDKISYRLAADYEVRIDRRSLEQILVNLLDNARKYAEGANIRISSKIEDDHFILTVRDWGPSFSKGQKANLFTPFNGHDDRENKNSTDGFGLGLAVCQQLAEANNGSINAEQANPGARFIVKLEIKQLSKQQESANTKTKSTNLLQFLPER